MRTLCTKHSAEYTTPKRTYVKTSATHFFEMVTPRFEADDMHVTYFNARNQGLGGSN